jgi:hypothetical protein
MIFEKFLEALSSYEKDHLLSLLKNDERIRLEDFRKLVELNKTTIDVWVSFKFSNKLRDTIANHYAIKGYCLSEDFLKSIDNYELKTIRNLGPKSISEYNEWRPKY